MNLPINYNQLTQGERREVRLEYIERQEGMCHYCRLPLKGKPSKKVMRAKINPWLFPTGFLLHPVHLHHSHKTGMTIGAVHALCNAYLWQFKGE